MTKKQILQAALDYVNVATFPAWDWIEAIHQAIIETTTLEDFDGLSLWWRDVVAGGAEMIRSGAERAKDADA